MVAVAFRRAVVAALAGGLLAGLALTAVQSIKVMPLILEAETYEGGTATAHSHGQEGHEHEAHAEWAPADGFERTAYTAFANVLTGVGFALLLAAVFSIGGEVDWRRGALWGLAGYGVFFVSPSIGLPPELPGSFAAELVARQAWWLFAAASAAAGLALLVAKRGWPWKAGGALVVVVPHLIGAPHPGTHGGLAPPELAQAFVAATAIANAVFWIVLGAVTGYLYRRLGTAP